MFSNLSRGSILHVLYTKDNIKLSNAIVDSVSMPRYKNNISNFNIAPEVVVDIVATVNGERKEFKQVPSNDAFADFGDNGFILFDNKESLISYATMKVRNNESIIDENNIAKLKKETIQYKDVLAELNQNQNNDETVKELKEQVNSFQAQLAEILALLKNNNNK